MDANLKRKWVAALRSGKYTQLRNGFHYEEKHCCIAVLGACISDKVPFPDGKILPWAERCKLINMNDNGKSFAEIADYVEQNL
jgi:hypothetical protein